MTLAGLVSHATLKRSLLCLDTSTYEDVGDKKGNEALGETLLVPYDDHLGRGTVAAGVKLGPLKWMKILH